MSTLALDVLYVHENDLQQVGVLGRVYGLDVHADPSQLAHDREDVDRAEQIERGLLWKSTQAEYRQAEVAEARDLASGIELTDGASVRCGDGTSATLQLREDKLWNLHKENGISFWGFAEKEMRSIVLLECREEATIQ
jgi:hypothetical protein